MGLENSKNIENCKADAKCKIDAKQEKILKFVHVGKDFEFLPGLQFGLRFALQNKVGLENSKNIKNYKADAKCKTDAKQEKILQLVHVEKDFELLSGLHFGLRFAFCTAK